MSASEVYSTAHVLGRHRVVLSTIRGFWYIVDRAKKTQKTESAASSMMILGLNFGHDAGVSLIKDGVFVSHWEKERHSRVRHAIGLRGRDIEDALKYFRVAISDISMVAVSTSQEVPLMLYDGVKFEFKTNKLINQARLNALVGPSRGFYARYKNDNRHEFGHYLASLETPPDQEIRIDETKFPVFIHQAETDFFALPRHSSIPMTRPQAHAIELTMTLGGARIPGIFISHHLCHAYYAYSQLGRGTALIVTFDGAPGIGAFIAGGLYLGSGGEIMPVFHHDFLFGFFYDAVGQSLGLGPVGASGKLMGLAAWGHPQYQDANLVGPPKEEHRYFGLERGGLYSKESMFKIWASRMSIPPPSLKLGECETPPQVDADIAASVQAMFTANVLFVVDAAIKIAQAAKFAYDYIVLSGGCALNCPANSAVFAKFGPNIFIPPAVNDEGISAGAALCCASWNGDRILSGAARGPADVAYKGIEYQVTPALLLDHPDLELVQTPDVTKFLASEIAHGAVVAVFEGRAEIGPRALGHRSLIASPLIAMNWKRMNTIKGREYWRPLAPVVLETEFARHFEGCPPNSYYMLFNARVRGTDLPAVTHRDGTSRVQVATAECGFIYHLLEAFREVTGTAVLLNTSFNGRGEPIIETPKQAVDAFASMQLDYLYLQGLLVKRKTANSRALS
jgi:carbamoyltransferase